MTKQTLNENDISVSVSMVTYNHEKYIAQAIESVLMQKTNFPVHLFIGDDGSTDETQQICLSYKSKYPDKITLILREKNTGMIYNIKDTFESAFNSGAKYIALLEGDDYWTDKDKLQKQVDFLENNPEYSMCFTNAKRLYEGTNTIAEYYPFVPENEYSFEELLYYNFVSNLTIVFRNKIHFPDWYIKVFPGDWQMHLLNAKKGKIGFINEYTAVYRHHESGVVSANSLIDNNKKYIKSFKILFWKFDLKSKIIILKTLGRLYSELALFYRDEGYRNKYYFYKLISRFLNHKNRHPLYLYR
jgi:glycosyltransferase involved in cell wall biosynthesis